MLGVLFVVLCLLFSDVFRCNLFLGIEPVHYSAVLVVFFVLFVGLFDGLENCGARLVLPLLGALEAVTGGFRGENQR